MTNYLDTSIEFLRPNVALAVVRRLEKRGNDLKGACCQVGYA